MTCKLLKERWKWQNKEESFVCRPVVTTPCKKSKRVLLKLSNVNKHAIMI